MASRRTLAIAGLALLATVATSGCLVEDFVPEPWVWRDVGQAGEDFNGADYSQSATFELADRTKRLRVRVDVSLENTQTNPVTTTLREGPGLNMTFRVGSGTTYQYFFSESETIRDLYPESTDEPATVTVEARGQGSWKVDVDAYEPKHQDWRWYAVWDR